MQLTVKSDRSEQFAYNSAHFPAYFGQGNLSDFPNYAALGHWHDDLEFSLILSGRMDYNVNGELVRVEEGEGIFINTRQLHYNFSRDQRDCRYLCVLLHPMLLCSSTWVEQDYVMPVLLTSSTPMRSSGGILPGDSRSAGSSGSFTTASGTRCWSRRRSFRFGPSCTKTRPDPRTGPGPAARA